jgi:hypothetical protein
VLLAQVLIGLGREGDALAELEQGVEERATDLIWLGVRPSYDSIRQAPRFRSILADVGLT